MNLRYEQLFGLGFTTVYYVDGQGHDDFVMEPTQYCKKQMSRYKILSKKTADGIVLFYECSPFTNDATPFRPILVEEKFTFKVTANNPNFWYYADVNNWEKDKVYFLRNPSYNTTGDISVLTGALSAPILFRPLEFMYDVLLDNVQGLLEIRDAAGILIKTMVIRAKTVSEPVGKKESYFINLKNYTDGLYTLRHIASGGNVDEQVYCSADYATGTLAIIEITYKGGVTWTGVAPFQKYIINISNRITDWFFDVYIRKKPVPAVLASELSIKHIPTGAEPVQTFTVVGAADDPHGFVQFKSDNQLEYSQGPMHLQLLKSLTDKILDPLPLPSSVTVQKNGPNLITKIIVNI